MSLRILLTLFTTIVVVRATGGHFDNILTAEQKQELEALKTEVKSDQSLTKAQIKQKFENYFNSLPAENKPSGNFTARIEEIKTNMETQIRSGLSAQAQPVFDEILTVKENMSLTPAQEHQQIQTILNNADPAIKTELETLKEKIHAQIHEAMGTN